MRAYFRELLGALCAIAEALAGIRASIHGHVTDRTTDQRLSDRVGELERELERRHAEAEGLLLRARGQLDAARAAEERARRLGKSSPGDEEGEEISPEELAAAYEAAGIQLEHGNGGLEEGVPPVQGGVVARRRDKSAAHAMKFSRG